MVGTEKQIAWAEKIKADYPHALRYLLWDTGLSQNFVDDSAYQEDDVVQAAADCIEALLADQPIQTLNDADVKMLAAIKHILTTDHDAPWWIDRRKEIIDRRWLIKKYWKFHFGPK
jgi:hypothetical protein